MSSHRLNNGRRLLAALLFGAPFSAWSCDFAPGYFLNVNLSAGALYVPRDAPPGTVIRDREVSVHALNPGQLCSSAAVYTVSSPLRAENGSPLVSAGEVLLHSDIPGVAVVVDTRLSPASWDMPWWNYVPGTGANRSGVPYVAHNLGVVGGSYDRIAHVTLGYRIIKTGPIEPGNGPYSLSGLTLARYSSNLIGPMIDIKINSGTLTVAQCSLPSKPGKQIRVDLGSWNQSDFNGEGASSDAMAFYIPLSGCSNGSGAANNHFAHIRLDPRNGSSVVDGPRGIVGLTADSTATGVAVQVLKDDLSPLALNEDVPIRRLQNGSITLPMAARYIQVGDAGPTGGIANAAVNFTITYR
ncbi:fimbrial protein [Pseudomonas rubra]|uniref:Type 1 fimbrial protein n=1 Tax=Pseudomonas rubra TaxID=2942627 RepID=A0ABT5P9K0_9PSED|nr:fimbrial protein [Pseudomonas rubra]MDD1014985.1 type 1 fimbrial protein [Pseudomonas rubra]MDD1038106.1 type 1 fimbrial protein [Pseudomonas rubra]MDD1156619.1 type 1 fimbrial protein [Pseudomonas rubra]